MPKASQNRIAAVAALAIGTLVVLFGIDKNPVNETKVENTELTMLGLADEADWREGQKAGLGQLARDLDQISRAAPEQLAQIEADWLDSNLHALQSKSEALFIAAVALSSLDDPEYDGLFRNMNSAERLAMSDKLIKASADLEIEAHKTEARLETVRAKIPPSGPTTIPVPPVIDVAAKQQELRDMFKEFGMSLPKN